MGRIHFAGAVLGLLVSCSATDDPDGPDGGPGGPVTLRGACPLAERLGGFTIALHESFSAVDGRVANGVVPVTVLGEVHAAGGCRLLRRENPFCSPACGPGTTCDLMGACVPFPERQDVGVVTVTGLRAPVEMRALQPGNDYLDTSLPHPAFDPGALIRLTSTDGYYGPLAMHGFGGEPLTVAGDAWTIERGRDLEVRWSAPTIDAPTRAFLELTIDQHGSSPLAVHCDFDDGGAAAVPADIVGRLLDAGVSGFPNGSLVRRTVDSVAVSDGCVEQVVSVPRAHAVRVVGHTACTSDDPCPEGQTCDLSTETCR